MDMVNESLPPMVNFNEFEVFDLVNKITKGNLNEEQAFALLREKLTEKGKTMVDTSKIPLGAMM